MPTQRQTIKEEKAVADAEIEQYQQRHWKAYHTSNQEFAKCERYCRQQRELVRAAFHGKAPHLVASYNRRDLVANQKSPEPEVLAKDGVALR